MKLNDTNKMLVLIVSCMVIVSFMFMNFHNYYTNRFRAELSERQAMNMSAWRDTTIDITGDTTAVLLSDRGTGQIWIITKDATDTLAFSTQSGSPTAFVHVPRVINTNVPLIPANHDTLWLRTYGATAGDTSATAVILWTILSTDR
jgi:hypothetical protein